MSEHTVGIVGAGATGGYLAAYLARAGVDVTLLTRGRNIERIRERGITVTGPDGERFTATPQRVVGSDDDVDPVDIALFCVKSYDTASAGREIAPLIGDEGTILCLQNGIANEDVLAELYGSERVLSGVLYIGSERVDVGEIHCSTPARVIFGPYEEGGGPTAHMEWIEKALVQAGIETTVSPTIRQAKWQKFLFNCGLNPLTTLTGLRLGAIRATDEGSTLFDDLVDEALAAARATGAPVAEDAREQVRATADRMDISSSMAEDLAAGRPLELDAFGGHVVNLADQAAVEVPVTRTVQHLLGVLDPGRAAR